MARTPQRLAGPMLVDSTAETVYTVPALTTAVIKNVTVANPSGGALTVTLTIGADATATRWLDAYSVAANSNANLFFYVVLDAADTIQAKSSGDDVLVITINGDEYA